MAPNLKSVKATAPARLAFSVLKADQTVSKVFSRNSDGSIEKSDAADCSKFGLEKLFVTDVAELARVVDSLSERDAFCAATPVKQGVTKIVGRTDARRGQDGFCARTVEDFEFRGPGFLPLDHDRSGPDKKGMSMDALRSALTSAVPELFENAPMALKPSTSAYIDGRGLTGLRGFVAIEDTARIPELAKALWTRLWADGHGWVDIGEAGQFLPRTLLDMSVFQTNRLFFIKPELRDGIEPDAPLGSILYNPEAAPFDGEIVITPDDLAKAAAALKDWKERLEPEAAPKRRAHNLKLAQERAERKKLKGDERDAYIEQTAAEFECAQKSGLLADDYPLIHQNGIALVKDIVADPKTWHGKFVRPPLDEDYRPSDWSVAKLYTLRGDDGPALDLPFIMSQAHGGQRFYLRSRQDIDQAIAQGFDYIPDAEAGFETVRDLIAAATAERGIKDLLHRRGVLLMGDAEIKLLIVSAQTRLKQIGVARTLRDLTLEVDVLRSRVKAEAASARRQREAASLKEKGITEIAWNNGDEIAVSKRLVEILIDAGAVFRRGTVPFVMLKGDLMTAHGQIARVMEAAAPYARINRLDAKSGEWLPTDWRKPLNEPVLDLVSREAPEVLSQTHLPVMGPDFVVYHAAQHVEPLKVLISDTCAPFVEMASHEAFATLWNEFGKVNLDLTEGDTRASLLAAVLTAALRRTFELAPCITVDAPESDSGKSTLVYMFQALTGAQPGKHQREWPRTREERPKALLSAFMNAEGSYLSWANISGDTVVTSDLLENIITSGSHSARLLGGNREAVINSRDLLLFDGSKLRVIDDMNRRRIAIKIRRPAHLVPGFGKAVIENPALFVNAAINLVKAYADAPVEPYTVSTFNDWSRIIGKTVRAVAGEQGWADPSVAGIASTKLSAEDLDERTAFLRQVYLWTRGASFTLRDLHRSIESGLAEDLKSEFDGLDFPRDLNTTQKKLRSWQRTISDRSIGGFQLEWAEAVIGEDGAKHPKKESGANRGALWKIRYDGSQGPIAFETSDADLDTAIDSVPLLAQDNAHRAAATTDALSPDDEKEADDLGYEAFLVGEHASAEDLLRDLINRLVAPGVAHAAVDHFRRCEDLL